MLVDRRIAIRSVIADEADARCAALSGVLIACVAGGASVGFMQPLAPDRAEAFWRGVARSVARGERILLVAEDRGGSGEVVGTVQLVVGQPENQPHRADLAKMLVHPGTRRQGIGAALLHAAEDAARAAGRTLLVLETASGDAERLYRRAGWVPVGVVPGYALWPDGRPCATTYFYKRLEPA
jgi:GNAT superfamily N-acetyltransferase